MKVLGEKILKSFEELADDGIGKLVNTKCMGNIFELRAHKKGRNNCEKDITDVIFHSVKCHAILPI